ncbi:hypothetical protein [Planomicrobium okeanokoites]|uniref:Uncharacterized protein n=1 Tax=Planomicrobium okeanokoites TaxID=244 RepID=A0ABV7KQV9_PLAOK|nr:hypothetical protein [Planomicrobium okeanokoites]TAA70831.1 hypothetical protein D2910_00710 [Planomicrobium okeanokoites]
MLQTNSTITQTTPAILLTKCFIPQTRYIVSQTTLHIPQTTRVFRIQLSEPSLLDREKHSISGFEVRETYEMTYFSRNRVKSWYRFKKTPKPNPNPKPKGMRQTRACLLK